MKTKISLSPQFFPQYDELYVISDLHLGGQKGFQIFAAGSVLKKFIDYVKEKDQPTDKKIALLINGDLVDFLAENPPLPFDPENAIFKLNRIVADEAFAMVWEALHFFAATPNRQLIINLGNHDLELALPWVQQHLLNLLARDDAAAAGRITLAFEGTGYACRVGQAQVLCVHGNEVDEWNIADYETIRRLGRDLLQGRPVLNWIPNAGTQLVIQIMNELKRKYPFIDLLKPEAQAVVPTLLALAPEYQDKLTAIAATTRRLFLDKIKIAAGFLGREEASATNVPFTEEPYWPDNTPAEKLTAYPANGLDPKQVYAAALLAETEERLQNNVSPSSLIQQELRGQQLGLTQAVVKYFRQQETSEVLREALEHLQQDRTFELKEEDETFKRLDALVSGDYDFLISGHTHLQRALRRRKQKGWYYNSGTWVKLIQLKKEVLQNPDKFRQVFVAFKAGTMADLDPYIQQQLTVVAITAEGPVTRGQLFTVHDPDQGELLRVVPHSQSE